MSCRRITTSLRMTGLFVGFLILATGMSSALLAQGNSDSNRNNILFTMQDKVIRFDIPSGLGVQVGTATGKINGVSITNFQFDLFSQFPIFTFHNRAGITDQDGDQIIFKVLGTGHFVVPPLLDPSVPSDHPDGFPDAPADQVLGGTGGPVSGTYEVLATSGKYSRLFRAGQKFPFRAVGYNPNPVAVVGGPNPTDQPLGAVYIEVFSNEVH
jgi:hypothetical protein